MVAIRPEAWAVTWGKSVNEAVETLQKPARVVIFEILQKTRKTLITANSTQFVFFGRLLVKEFFVKKFFEEQKN